MSKSGEAGKGGASWGYGLEYVEAVLIENPATLEAELPGEAGKDGASWGGYGLAYGAVLTAKVAAELLFRFFGASTERVAVPGREAWF